MEQTKNWVKQYSFKISLHNFLPAAKQAAKYDPERELQAKEWIQLVAKTKFDESLSFQENLKDGVMLCDVINGLKPGTIKTVNASKMPFKQVR